MLLASDIDPIFFIKKAPWIAPEGFEATPGIEPGMRVLQTRALPLGYVAKELPE